MSDNQSKQINLYKAMTAFRDDPNSTTLRDMLVVFFYATLQGSGLGWQQIDQPIFDVFGERPNPPTIKEDNNGR